MILVTNRNLQPAKPPVERFGGKFNDKGPNELRLAEFGKTHGQWELTILDDQITHKGEKLWASEYVFLRLQERMRAKKRNALFFYSRLQQQFKRRIREGRRTRKKF